MAEHALTRPGPTGWRNNYFLKSFFLGLGLSFLVFLPFLVVDGGRFLFYGDFNVQQVPFYRLAHDAVRAGEFGWNYKTDLGVNFIGSYSFYLLGSPFFWLTIPFPSQWVQYLMGPLLILKFACASLTAYVYLHRYTKSGDTALIGAILYAFSGFSVYNIFFNHFHEAIITFPLLLAALDEYMVRRRRGLFALTVAFCCLVNYYFFVGQVTFTVIYFVIRMASGSWRIRFPDFLLLALEAVLGLGISCVLLIPSVLAVVQNTRTWNIINGWSAVLYNKNQRYLHILECFFFPPDLPARPNFTPDSDSKWASLGAWLPLFSMTGVIGWLQLRRKHWLKKMLWALFFMALVPGLNASFQMLNSAFYARWYYMLVLMMCLATVMALENEEVNWKRSTVWTLVITGTIAAAVGFVPTLTTTDGVEQLTVGLEQYPARFWTYVAVAGISLAALIYIFLFCRRSRRAFYRGVKTALYLIAVLYSVYFISIGKTQSDYTWDHLIPYALNGGREVNLPDLQETRSDFYESLDNSAMFWEIPSIQAFHSIVPGSVMEFYESIGVTRDVASRPDTTHYALRGLTSVHWLFDDDHDDAHFAGVNDDEPAMPGWAYYGNLNGFDVWENMHYIPMGFSYDSFISRSAYNAMPNADRERIMLRAVVLEDADVVKAADLMAELHAGQEKFSQAAYLDDCDARAATACEGFTYIASGFTATAPDLGYDRLVFFSVPYESGWSAEVNGVPTEILKANVGFMAVRVPTGTDASIVFRYRTPGLLIGAVVTVLSVALLTLYLVLAHRLLRRKAPARLESRVRVGRFADYAKARGASFQRKGALKPKSTSEAMIPEEEPAIIKPSEEREEP